MTIESGEPGAGRYAPSPSGDLHIGNLRTALLAWLFARSTGRRFVLRMEDLDRVRPGAAERQLADLAALGLDWDGPVVRQSARTAVYDAAIADLTARGLTYECFCTRREIQSAPSAPHSPPGAYPGTCRDLLESERARRRAERSPAIRLRAEPAPVTIVDDLHGEVTGVPDDVVLRRGDGVAAYNLAVVVDDAAAGVDQVVRGDDLLTSAPRQAYLTGLLGHPAPRYAHVPMVLRPDGVRLAKRDGAVTLAELVATGWTPARVLTRLAESLGLVSRGEPADLLSGFDPAALPREPWLVALPLTDAAVAR